MEGLVMSNKKLFLVIVILCACMLFSCGKINDPLNSLNTNESYDKDLSGISPDDLIPFEGTSGKTVISTPQLLFPYNDRLFYILDMLWDADLQTAYMYNITTGRASPVCQDPVCTHKADSQCPFKDPFHILGVWDNLVYYCGSYSGYDSRKFPVYTYNLITMERIKLFDVLQTDNTNVLLCKQGDRLYYRNMYINEKAETIEYALEYFDLTTRRQHKLLIYDTQSISVNDSYRLNEKVFKPMLVDDKNRIYFSEQQTDGNGYTATYLLCSDDISEVLEPKRLKKLTDKCNSAYYRDGEWIYSKSGSICAVSADTLEERLIVSDAKEIFAYSTDCIYYQKQDPQYAEYVYRLNLETGVTEEFSVKSGAGLSTVPNWSVYYKGSLYTNVASENNEGTLLFLRYDLLNNRWCKLNE